MISWRKKYQWFPSTFK